MALDQLIADYEAAVEARVRARRIQRVAEERCNEATAAVEKAKQLVDQELTALKNAAVERVAQRLGGLTGPDLT